MSAVAVSGGPQEQMDLGFAFTKPLEIQVIKDKPQKKDKAINPAGVQGAPPNSAVWEKGAPPGSCQVAAPAAASEVVPKAKGRGKGQRKQESQAQPKAPTAAVAAAPDSPEPPVAGFRRPAACAAKTRVSKCPRIQIPPDAEIGCSKCGRNKQVGCNQCRLKAGLVKVDKSNWAWPADVPASAST